MQNTKMNGIPNRQHLIEAMEHISFEMNRYIYTANAINTTPQQYKEAISESCLLHSRAIGEFFFEEIKNNDDIRISHYSSELTSKNELLAEIEKNKPKWAKYKRRLNKKLGHLTFSRINTSPMNMWEKNELNFEILIELFERSLPIDFKEKWDFGKSISQ